jgi:hypothetical protein
MQLEGKKYHPDDLQSAKQYYKDLIAYVSDPAIPAAFVAAYGPKLGKEKWGDFVDHVIIPIGKGLRVVEKAEHALSANFSHQDSIKYKAAVSAGAEELSVELFSSTYSENDEIRRYARQLLYDLQHNSQALEMPSSATVAEVLEELELSYWKFEQDNPGTQVKILREAFKRDLEKSLCDRDKIDAALQKLTTLERHVQCLACTSVIDLRNRMHEMDARVFAYPDFQIE